uniref:NADH-ubiquinone oxidoreductase chain 6 n=2 Tax=Dicronychus TaxID=942001 RepID=A0A343C2Y1_9COLE|nr:NADH deshydrogenase subunit 6 [Dicronychus sp. DIC01]ARH54374.1 NADH dehydrogenase subunit 6 [Dicronychus cinereus]
MTTFSILSIFLTTLFLFTAHPLSMGFVLLAQTLLISMMTGSMAINFWYSYIIFIIMIGGMLVLFIYMTSVASNEKFKMSKMMMLTSLIASMLFITSLFSEKFLNPNTTKNSEMSTFLKQDFITFTMNKYLTFPSSLIMLFLIIYLLITLIAVVKITNIKYGPLRQKF